MSGGNARRDLALGRQRVSNIAAVPAGMLLHPSAGSQQAESHSQVTPVAVRLFHDLIEFHTVRQNAKQIEDPAAEKSFQSGNDYDSSQVIE